METPPHAWGRLAVGQPYIPGQGNTPTCVGKTRGWTGGSRTAGKHPHMRGEDSAPLRPFLWKLETPPHAWGRRRSSRCAWQGRGNTPTCVGKTRMDRWTDMYVEKHPHMRGEDAHSTPYPNPVGETPPHAWGRLENRPINVALPGNTPTCVGKTLNDH